MEMNGKTNFPTEYLSADYFEKVGGRKAYAFWLVGNSGSGKSTLTKTVEKMLMEHEYWVKCLDGDNMRSTINSDLDLSIDSRTENVRRSAEISKMFLMNGTTTINCFISPTEESRNQAQKIIGERFRLIYIKASHSEVKKRDVKGLYKDNAENMNNSLKLFEEPNDPDLILDTTGKTIKYSANILFNFIINQPI
jgi:adenylylsulfate kinase|tara:strand:- start:607 stop:1188 length:582 start_codon:yes stop_codon:yes gene_type:complete